jgi:rhodanese-related sulfurtransferase
MTKRPLVQALLLVLISAVIAVVANAMAGRERRLLLPGFYPNALKVPQRPVAVQVPPPAPPPVTTTTVEPAPVVRQPEPKVEPAVEPKVEPKPREVPVLERFAPHPDRAYVEIAYPDVRWLYDRGALFLDARRTSVFEEGHITGARPYSVWESDIDDKVTGLFNERPDPEEQNQPIVIYCSGGACEDSHMLAEKLWGIQFNNVYVYKDGYPDWVKRGGPTRRGSTP